MRILMINVSCGSGSTGRICFDIAQQLSRRGHDVKKAYGRGYVPEICKQYSVRVGNQLDVYVHAANARFFDNMGFRSKRVTAHFLNWVDQFQPDLIHLHNIHGYYLNIELLFSYIKKRNIPVVWTLHDCWPFTGHCAYFDLVDCNKWKTHCHSCPQKHEYPKRWIFDRSYLNYEKKKALFNDVSRLTIVTPSKWLEDLVHNSFLKGYRTEVINNGIDINLFSHKDSDIKNIIGVGNKFVILGVASIWDKRKGIDVFIELSKRLPTEKYAIVLIGIDEKLKRQIPKEIIAINKTEDIQQLSEFYSMANVFLNPTYEDNYPTTNLEAIACDTPVVTFKTGGSPESAVMYGTAVESDDYDALVKSINSSFKRNYNREDLSSENTVEKYLRLYSKMLKMGHDG